MERCITFEALSAPSNPTKLREELAYLRCRYDTGAVSAGVYTVIKALEIEVAWLEREGAGR